MIKICNTCIMDSEVPEIKFNTKGQCNFCLNYIKTHGDGDYEKQATLPKNFTTLVNDIKRKGKNNKYDCIIGISGGVDSAWVLVKAIEQGLRPLVVHFDNGWNSELAQNNIAFLIEKCGVDLYTHVVNWEEYRSLMQSFFDANVIDIELLYDNAMMAINYKLAKEYGVKYILAGTNNATEGMEMPNGWNWFKLDKKNIISINKHFGNIKLKTYPSMGTYELIKYSYINNIKWISFLNYIDYKKQTALKVLTEQYNYKPYPYKHYESIFTRFYQGYILPRKFNVDKRKVHFSNLIVTNQMSRDEALSKIKQSPYPAAQDLERDIQYFLKKMKWTKTDLDEYIQKKEVSHSFFKSELTTYKFIFKNEESRPYYKKSKKVIREIMKILNIQRKY